VIIAADVDVVDVPLLEVAEQRLAIDPEHLCRLGSVPVTQLEHVQDVTAANLIDGELKLGGYKVGGHDDHSMNESPAKRPFMRRKR
jgi:hypothetical protein